MDWYWQLLIHAVAVYGTVGLYLGVMWYWIQTDSSNGRPFGTAEKIIMPVFMMCTWPFDIQPADQDNLLRGRKTVESKARHDEQKRMAVELARETAQVEMLEASANHRKKMAELDERRKRVEEVG